MTVLDKVHMASHLCTALWVLLLCLTSHLHCRPLHQESSHQSPLYATMDFEPLTLHPVRDITNAMSVSDSSVSAVKYRLHESKDLVSNEGPELSITEYPEAGLGSFAIRGVTNFERLVDDDEGTLIFRFVFRDLAFNPELLVPMLRYMKQFSALSLPVSAWLSPGTDDQAHFGLNPSMGKLYETVVSEKIPLPTLVPGESPCTFAILVNPSHVDELTVSSIVRLLLEFVRIGGTGCSDLMRLKNSIEVSDGSSTNSRGRDIVGILLDGSIYSLESPLHALITKGKSQYVGMAVSVPSTI